MTFPSGVGLLHAADELLEQGGVDGGAQMLHPGRYRNADFGTFATFVHGYLAARNAWRLDGVFRPRAYYVGREPQQTLNHLGRFDRLADTEDWLSDTLARDVRLIHSNATSRGDYRSYYDSATRDIVGRIYRADIEQFGFDF